MLLSRQPRLFTPPFERLVDVPSGNTRDLVHVAALVYAKQRMHARDTECMHARKDTSRRLMVVHEC
eukprot:3889952-Pleurochrysis_carterae.AAC.2